MRPVDFRNDVQEILKISLFLNINYEHTNAMILLIKPRANFFLGFSPYVPMSPVDF